MTAFNANERKLASEGYWTEARYFLEERKKKELQ